MSADLNKCAGKTEVRGATLSGRVMLSGCDRQPDVVVHDHYEGAPACRRHIGQVVAAMARLRASGVGGNRSSEVTVTPWETWEINYPSKPIASRDVIL